MNLILKVVDVAPQPSPTVNMRCPSCHQRGTFEAIGVQDIYLGQANRRLGQRRCPNPQCLAHVFTVVDPAGEDLVASYPPERIDFDASSLPAGVLAALEEAITCHANQCFTAAAIMVRKTLEELCSDRHATGASLKDRITKLGKRVVIPKELLDGLDDIRLLGNDATHFESQVYDDIGQEEVEIAIDFTKEVLKAVYQYAALLARLRGLKSQDTDP